MPKFEFDEAKSQSNLAKHGIDFVEAQAIWQDDDMAIDQTRTEGEERFLAIGNINGKLWTAVYTPRNSAIRLISCRRSRNTEKAIYDNQ